MTNSDLEKLLELYDTLHELRYYDDVIQINITKKKYNSLKSKIELQLEENKQLKEELDTRKDLMVKMSKKILQYKSVVDEIKTLIDTESDLNLHPTTKSIGMNLMINGILNKFKIILSKLEKDTKK